MKTKKENIAEYILQMWQMEDLVRAFKDDEALEQNEFLSDLKNMMHAEGVMQSGHVNVANVAMTQMEDLHKELYDREATYRAAWLQLMPSMTVLKAKTNNPTQSDMEVCLTFLYEIMLLRLQKKEISADTLAIQQQVSKLLAYLAAQYAQSLEQAEQE